jgi:hypothetical protein
VLCAIAFDLREHAPGDRALAGLPRQEEVQRRPEEVDRPADHRLLRTAREVERSGGEPLAHHRQSQPVGLLFPPPHVIEVPGEQLAEVPARHQEVVQIVEASANEGFAGAQGLGHGNLPGRGPSRLADLAAGR